MKKLSKEQMGMITGNGWVSYFNYAKGIYEWVYIEDQPCNEH